MPENIFQVVKNDNKYETNETYYWKKNIHLHVETEYLSFFFFLIALVPRENLSKLNKV